MTNREDTIYKLAEIAQKAKKLKKENKELIEDSRKYRDKYQILISWLHIQHPKIHKEFSDLDKSKAPKINREPRKIKM